MQAPPGEGSPPLTTEMQSVIRRGVRFGYCTTDQAPLAELVAEADETSSRTFFTLNSMSFINCCWTERNQPTTFGQENI